MRDRLFREDIAALIITFNPNISLLKRNIEATKRNVGENYVIVDNGSRNVLQILNLYDAHTIKLDENKGIAVAQNVGFSYLTSKKYKWVLLLDQDSIIPENMIAKMKETNEFYDKKTGMIGIAFQNQYYKRCGIIQNNEVIASGSLIRTFVWKTCGGMDEDLFIDYVDFDFNARVKMSGYSIYQNTEIVMKHEIGETIYAPIRGKILHMGQRKGYFSDHSSLRLYYFYKNSIIVKKRYPGFFNQDKNPVWLNIRRLREIIVYKRPRLKKMFAAIKGIYEGARYDPQKDERFQRILRKIKNQSI